MRFAAIALACVTLAPALAAAQQPPRRARVNVDYIAGSSLYISAGQGQGLFQGDTVHAYREAATSPVGKLVVTSSTRSRAVATFVGEPFALSRGDVLLLEIGEAAYAKLRLLEAQRDTVRAAATVVPEQSMVPTATRSPTGAHISGRIGIDYDAFQTMTRWGSDPDERSEVTYTTPTLRLHVAAADLPGGMRFSANMRGSYFSSSGTAERRLSLQMYQAMLQTDFGGAPFRLQAGRFYNPYESHSGYWDGALLRVGGPGIGVGVVAGYEPTLANQAFSTEAPKTTLFFDVHKRGGRVRYDGDVSLHRHNHELLSNRREFAGVSQRLSFGRTYITQRLQVGRDSSGNADLWQLQVTGNIAVAGPLHINARYSRERSGLYFISAASAGNRIRRTLGASLAGRVGYASIEVGDVDSGTGDPGRTVATSISLPRIVAGLGVSLSANRWEESDFTSTFASSTLERDLGKVHARAGVRYYRTNYGSSLFEQRGGEVTLALPLPQRSEITLTAGTMRGDRGYNNHVLLSMWKSF